MAKRGSREAQLTGAARRDLLVAIKRSLKAFGADAALRYKALMDQALKDIAADPKLPGSRQHSDLAPGVLIYDLRFSRDRSTLGVVKAPRHLLVYRVVGLDVQVLRIIHDARDLRRHVGDQFLR